MSGDCTVYDVWSTIASSLPANCPLAQGNRPVCPFQSTTTSYHNISIPKAAFPMTSPRRDFLGEGLAELKGTIKKSMQDCKTGDKAQIEERHNDEFLEAIQADVSELARMAAAERRDSASHTTDMINQLRRIVEQNHRLVLSLTEETFQSLKEEQQIRHAEVLRTIQESRGKR